jgi:6-phosphofructokinase 1
MIVIGGDGSFHAAMGIQSGLDIPLIGIPATIDNDIPGTDETIGFDTAVNTALEEIDKIRDTATSHERIFVVEVMGRNTGFIALHVGIGAGAEMILVPELKYSFQIICDQLEFARKIGKNSSIIVMAEGVGDSLDFVRRIDELGLYETRLTILGHVQRGGSPSARSRILASRFGVAAVDFLLEGKKRNYVGIRNDQLVTPKLDNVISGPKQLDEGLLRIANILSRLTFHPP